MYTRPLLMAVKDIVKRYLYCFRFCQKELILCGVYQKLKAKADFQGKGILPSAIMWMSLEKPEHRKTKCMITCICEPLNVQITELENKRWVARHWRLGEVYQRL